MKFLKRIINYIFWTLTSFIASFVYMRIVLGPKPKDSVGFMKIFDWIYDFAMLHIGAIIGAIVSVIYILLDIFYLNKKLKNLSKRNLLRFFIIILITTIVGSIHYILEKVIDVI